MRLRKKEIEAELRRRALGKGGQRIGMTFEEVELSKMSGDELQALLDGDKTNLEKLSEKTN